jgi:hypothetical protein
MSESILLAARRVLHAWEAESAYEKNNLSPDLWEAIDELRRAVLVIKEVM